MLTSAQLQCALGACAPTAVPLAGSPGRARPQVPAWCTGGLEPENARQAGRLADGLWPDVIALHSKACHDQSAPRGTLSVLVLPRISTLIVETISCDAL